MGYYQPSRNQRNSLSDFKIHFAGHRGEIPNTRDLRARLVPTHSSLGQREQVQLEPRAGVQRSGTVPQMRAVPQSSAREGALEAMVPETRGREWPGAVCRGGEGEEVASRGS